MFFHKPMNPEECQKMIDTVGQIIENIFQKDDKKSLSYQLAYDHIYQLCRQQKQQEILGLLIKKVEQYVPEEVKTVDIESQKYLQAFTMFLKKAQKKIESIVQICLYLDLNYCQRDLNIKLSEKLSSVFFQALIKQTEIMKKIGSEIAKAQIQNELKSIINFLQELHFIDETNEYFGSSFIPYYCPILVQHYKASSSQNFAKKQINQYIQWAKTQLFFQRQFLTTNFKSKKATSNINFIMKEIYMIMVTQFKEQIYAKHEKKLFQNLTCEILELFMYGLNKDIQLHAEWYNGIIIKRLNLIPTTNNEIFIQSISKFYKQIMEILQTTYNKFDIHYRSRFAFEQWINVQNLQVPQRLNDYINKKCLQKQDTTKFSDVMEYVNIIFVLMKEKYLFQKLFRRSLINRLIKFEYIPKHDIEIIANMEKQCSEEFVKNITPIVKSYQDMKLINKEKASASIQTIIINMENWPFQEKNQSVALHKGLVAMAQPFTDNFTQNNKDKNLYWHPNIGTMMIVVHFSQDNSKQFIVDTCMGNLLLPFNQKRQYKLKDFCCQTGYKLDQVYDSLKKLIETKVVVNLGSQQNYILSLNEQYTSQQKAINLLQISSENEFQVKALSELKADRKFMVQAIIIKIIKKLKISSRAQILIQAAPMIQKKGFSFNSDFVQKSIDRLIDKEFIRDHQDGKIGYIA